MEQGLSVGLVLKDLNLAEANQVNGTPTLFVNGHRAQGVENAARLRELIAEARKEAAMISARPAQPVPGYAGSGTR
jgi:protein-disulfide isomerase